MDERIVLAQHSENLGSGSRSAICSCVTTGWLHALSGLDSSAPTQESRSFLLILLGGVSWSSMWVKFGSWPWRGAATFLTAPPQNRLYVITDS